MPSDDSSPSCCPDFPGAQYARGPSDKNPAMFDFEKKMADQIAARCGPATSPQHNLGDLPTGKGLSSPGQD